MEALNATAHSSRRERPRGSASAATSTRSPSLALAIPLALIVALGEWNGLVRGLVGAPVLGFLLDVGLIALDVAVFVRSPRAGTSTQLRGVDLLVGAYFAIAIAEILNPNVPSVTVGVEGFRKSAMMCIGYFVVRLSGARDGQAFVTTVAALSIPALIMGVRQVLWPLPIDLAIIDSSSVAPGTFLQGGAVRAFSPTSGPFLFGLVASLSLMVAITAAMAGRLRWIAVALLASVALALSITRANIVATVIGLIVVSVVYQWSIGRRSVAVTLAGTFVFLVSVATLVGSLFGGIGFEHTIAELSASMDPFTDRNFDLRLGYWVDFSTAIGENPIIGYGTSSAADGFDSQYASAGGQYFNPHSIYFKVILEMGIIGLALLSSILVALSIAAARCPEPFLRAASLGVLVLVLVSGISGPMLDAYPFNLVFWVLAGYVINSRSLREESPVHSLGGAFVPTSRFQSSSYRSTTASQE